MQTLMDCSDPGITSSLVGGMVDDGPVAQAPPTAGPK
jgi:hypothetical protein